ncbi:MAG: peptidase dimerization domain-containing protein [Bryobacterales bacterium]|nr:peptidase dimerization domain-containing protein [Bryobacterales bacterium]
MKWLIFLLMFCATVSPSPAADAAKTQAMKADLAGQVEAMSKQAQVMTDMVFSFGELGFQEVETSKYLTGILEKEGFAIERGVAGIPTAWVARWGTGKPVIALGSDIDCIPQASQRPGVAYHDPLIEGAPGHGEGHNSGQVVNILAALAVKKLMEREKIPGTLMLWPGVAEELLGTKAYFVRAGIFKDADAVIFSHVASNFGVSSGPGAGSGLISVEYHFRGESAHSAVAPWRGRSALDAVELMNIGMNFRREHLPLAQRTHYVITDGGDQPNVVPPNATVWYYFRQLTYDSIMNLWKIGDRMAEGATMMTDTSVTSRVLGSAWPGHFSKPIAEAVKANIQAVGLPGWSNEDQTLAKALQKELGVEQEGLPAKLDEDANRDQEPDPRARLGGGSDDIGDVSWNVPTVVLRYPSNIPGLPGHNWANAVAMATPIAHKGVVAGAKVEAMSILDLLTNPDLVAAAWDYFRNVQTKNETYRPLIRPEDKPAIWLNEGIMREYRPRMKEFYYSPEKYGTYLEQLGVKYPTVR